MSKATKVELDMYNLKTNKYTKFQVDISDTTEKSLENKMLAKDNDSCKSESNKDKLKLDLS